jgi:lipoprotein-releasing system permease protein
MPALAQLARKSSLLQLWGDALAWVQALPTSVQWALGGFALLLLLAALVFAVRRLLRRGMRTLLAAIALSNLLLAAGLTLWVWLLPLTRGTQFVMWHQVVRAGAVISLVIFVMSFAMWLVPWVMNRIERGGVIGFVAARHMLASKSGFLTIISLLSVMGVFLSSFALCAVISVMGGFGSDLKRKILGNNAHISVDRDHLGGFGDWDSALDEVRVAEGVQAAMPVAAGEAMASSNSNTAGVIIRGVELDSVGTVIDLVKNIEVGDFKYLQNPEALSHLPSDTVIGIGPGGHEYLQGPRIDTSAPGLDPDVVAVLKRDDVYPGLIIGREIAKSLHVLLGDEVRLVAPLGDLGPMGVLPRTRRFRIAGIFYSGMYEYDATHVYMTLETAQEFLDLQGKVTTIEVKVEDVEGVSAVRDRLQSTLTARELRVRDWKELNRNLFSALKLEKIATFVVLCLTILVACFCIICTLLLMVTEKSKEIAIIKSLGASDGMILRVFMLEGLIIGGGGTVFGVTVGWVAAAAVKRFGLRLDPAVYYVDRLPIEVSPPDYALVAICALVITVLATIGPALAAAQLRPVDGIRYE